MDKFRLKKRENDEKGIVNLSKKTKTELENLDLNITSDRS
jgi:hypothetical protein